MPSAKPQKEMIDLASTDRQKSGRFDAKKFDDHYSTALKELVHETMKGHTIVAHEVERPTGGNVVDLMEALKRSVGEGPWIGEGEERVWREKAVENLNTARPRVLKEPTLRALGSKREREACGS